MVTTVGRTIIDGLPGDDILEDHNAEAALIGGAGNDRLIILLMTGLMSLQI